MTRPIASFLEISAPRATPFVVALLFFWTGAPRLMSFDGVSSAKEPQTSAVQTTWDEQFLESTSNELREELDAF
ncbi:MAG: hypothetical protein IKX88_00495, partial [Thermoguttaceae bacterium]|nr:hypothetical protein [Thermoguttaceae bacterium]